MTLCYIGYIIIVKQLWMWCICSVANYYFSIENYKIPPENVVSCNSQYPIHNKTQKEFKECNKTFIFLLLIS